MSFLFWRGRPPSFVPFQRYYHQLTNNEEWTRTRFGGKACGKALHLICGVLGGEVGEVDTLFDVLRCVVLAAYHGRNGFDTVDRNRLSPAPPPSPAPR